MNLDSLYSSANPEHGKIRVQGDGKSLHNTNESGPEIRKKVEKRISGV